MSKIFPEVRNGVENIVFFKYTNTNGKYEEPSLQTSFETINKSRAKNWCVC